MKIKVKEILFLSLFVSLSACTNETSSKVSTSESTEQKTAVEQTEEEIQEAETVVEEEEPYSDFKVFASEKMDFSFRYDPANTAYMTDTGAAELAINGNDSLVGLFVSVVDAEFTPEPDEILEEDIYNLKQKYSVALAVKPVRDNLMIGDHSLTGITYTYNDMQGETIDCTKWIESRDGKYIFYETETYRDQSGPDFEAMVVAVETLVLSDSAYGTSDAKSGSIRKDTTPVFVEEPSE